MQGATGQVIVENEINLAVLECLGSTKVACTKPQSIFSSSLLVSRSRPSCPRSTSFVSSTSIITFDHMKKLKNNTFVGNTGHFDKRVRLGWLRQLRRDGSRPHQASEDRSHLSPRWSQCDHDEAFEGFFYALFQGFKKVRR